MGNKSSSSAGTETPGMRQRRIFTALQQHDFAELQRILAQGGPLTPGRLEGEAPTAPRLLNQTCLFKSGFAPLHVAAFCCDAPFIQQMLQAGADVNVRSRCTLEHLGSASRDSPGRSELDLVNIAIPVIGSTAYSHQLTRGIHPHVLYHDQGLTPIMIAVIFAPDERVLSVCEALLVGGANLSLSSISNCWTVLMLAAQRGHIQLWRMLREAGASLEPRNELDEDVRLVAERWASRPCRNMIEAEEQRRDHVRARANEVLGDQVRMAQVCIDMVLQYAGFID